MAWAGGRMMQRERIAGGEPRSSPATGCSSAPACHWNRNRRTCLRRELHKRGAHLLSDAAPLCGADGDQEAGTHCLLMPSASHVVRVSALIPQATHGSPTTQILASASPRRSELLAGLVRTPPSRHPAIPLAAMRAGARLRLLLSGPLGVGLGERECATDLSAVS
jgi:hypothetical protein